jgi:hypothetical protein
MIRRGLLSRRGLRWPTIAAVVVAALPLLAAAPAVAASPVTNGSVLPEVPVTVLDERVQFGNNSPVLAVDPTEPRFVALASRLDNPDFGCALHLSGDGGRGWVPAQPVPELPEGADKCYAPEVTFDEQGVLYFLFIALAGQGNTPSGTYLVTSSDRGRTYGSPVQVLGPERYMVRMAVDPTMGEKGRIHIVWLEVTSDAPVGGLPPSRNPIMSAYSDDGGRTFSTPVQVSDPSRQRVVAPALALGPDHAVHVLYYDLEDDVRDYQGLEGPTWEGKWSLVSSSSYDGGRRFSTSVVVDDGVVPPERVMLIYTMPAPALAADQDGRLFAAWYDARSGDWDVFLRRSPDRGRTWEPPRRLSDDPLRNGRHQYFPRLAVSPDGRLDAIFYDRRGDPQNLRNDVFLTSSDDGGATFSPNVRLTSEPSHSQIGTRYPIPSAAGLVEFGSRIALVSEEQRILAAWTDTRNSEEETYEQEIFATGVDLPGGSGGSPLPIAGAAAAAVVIALGFAVIRRRRRARVPEQEERLDT